MKKNTDSNFSGIGRIMNRINLKLRPKLILIFLVVKVIPIIVLTVIALTQVLALGSVLRDIAVEDSMKALNDGARQTIERQTTDTSKAIAKFLSDRDADMLKLARLASDPASRAANYEAFSETSLGLLTKWSPDDWKLSDDGKMWVQKKPYEYKGDSGASSNSENNDPLYGSAFNFRPPEFFEYETKPLYDEITFVEKSGAVSTKIINSDTTKTNYPLNTGNDISVKANTYIKSEGYFAELEKLKPGDIYVSDVIGAYVGTNYAGMYTPAVLKSLPVPAAPALPHPNREHLVNIGNVWDADGNIVQSKMDAFMTEAKKQAFAGQENPVGQRFEGIVRFATPVTNPAGSDNPAHIVGYATMALNHDHIMEFVDYITPMNERYVPLTSAFEGNYAFIWDYKCRSIAHPRHHSIVGYNPDTGEPQVPWLEGPIFNGWKAAAEIPDNPMLNDVTTAPALKWFDYINNNGIKEFDAQSRTKAPARDLTRLGLVGLDGRYLNNAPQCTGWMDLTRNGGSGSFYILWSGLYKPTTAAAITYYTGQYSKEAQGNARGFAFVTIGAGIEDFIQPAKDTEAVITDAITSNTLKTTFLLIGISVGLVIVIILIAVLLSSYLTGNIKFVLSGISRFRGGERQIRLHSSAKDEFGALANSFDEMADSLVNSVSEPLSIVDAERKIIYMNAHALAVLDKTLDEVIGTSYDDISLYPHGSRYCPITALNECKEADVMYQENSGHYFKGMAHYLFDQAGKKTGYIIMTSDVTEIEIARQKAEAASQAKSNFLANMSHEIRTPINAIIGMATIGAGAPDVAKKDYAIEKIQDASTHLLGVINDVLDMSKIEAKKFNLSNAEFVFDKMVQRVVDVINFRVDEKHQKLTVGIDSAIPQTLIGDDQRLAQVIANLLTNAVKFTAEKGEIHLAAHLQGEKNGICTLLISVKDNGIGINAEQKKRLFSAFEQAESSTTRKYGGTGLGLVISQSIVEMMDGKIWVESEIGKGSEFLFTVNLARGSGEVKRLFSAEKNLTNTTMLAIDDDPAILEFFRETAKQIGIACDVAPGGLDALALIAERGAYNIYFVDWKMPEMNGIEFARVIHGRGEDNTVIIMISAHDWSAIRDEANKAGVTRFIPKPLFISAITDCLDECLGAEKDDFQNQDAAVPDFKGRRILLAEDVEINREIVLALLEPTGIEIDCAENGQIAVDLFAQNPEKYDLIFMDIQMPTMDGYTASKNIRASGFGKAKEIPIVAMTANVFKEDVDKCIEAGMDGHIGKPLDFNEVLKILEKYLRKG